MLHFRYDSSSRVQEGAGVPLIYINLPRTSQVRQPGKPIADVIDVTEAFKIMPAAPGQDAWR